MTNPVNAASTPEYNGETKVFGIFDSKADAFVHVFMSKTAGLAIRGFAAAAQDANHEYHRFAGDFTLFELGVFDERNGRHVDHDVKVNLGNAIHFATESAE